MPLYNLTDATTPDEILIGMSSSVSVFPIMTLVFVWFVIFLGGINRQSSRFGYSDVPQWSVMASLACLMLGLIMTILQGIITIQILGIIIAINILTGVWFFLSRGRFE